MKRSTAAAMARDARATASESKWQEWISNLHETERARAEAQPAAVNGNGQPSHEAIALLAYALWEQRGRPIGSPEEDWLRAELQMLQHHTTA